MDDSTHDGNDPDSAEASASGAPTDDSTYDLSDPARRAAGFKAARLAFSCSGLVVMPTDTVYGLAADAFDPAGVRRLLRAKGRGRDMPAPVLVGSADTVQALAHDVGAEARALMDAFWPGGLSLICRQQGSLRWDLGDNRGTVMLRMPDLDDARDLLNDNGPLAVSSANASGEPPATDVAEAARMLGTSVDVYLDGGATPGPVPSTIVDTTGPVLRVVRHGAVGLGRLREVVPEIDGDEPV